MRRGDGTAELHDARKLQTWRAVAFTAVPGVVVCYLLDGGDSTGRLGGKNFAEIFT